MSTNEQALRQVMKQWGEALERGDTAAMMRDYEADAMLYDCKPPYVVRGVQAIKGIWDACLPFFPKEFTVEYRDQTLQVGEDMALMTGIVHFVIPKEPDHPGGQTWLRVSVVYRKGANGWKVMHEHVSLPYNPMTNMVAMIKNPDDVMCGVSYEGCEPPK